MRFIGRRGTARAVIAALAALVVLLPSSFNARAATIMYVDKSNPSCSDTGPGDSATPFCSLGLAAKKATAGTTVQVAAGTYNEPEGIFPDGLYTTVEADRQCERLGGERGHGNIDIWKLKLDGTGKDFTRVTNFNDYEGGKASNPVISTDGRFMAFQAAKTDDPAGVGYGILIYWF